jgi:hypothetical protein
MCGRAKTSNRIRYSVTNGQSQRDSWILPVFAPTALLIICFFSATGRGLAQSPNHSASGPLVNFQSGQVTSPKSGTSVEINDRVFTTKEQVLIRDDEGRPRDEKDLSPGSEIKFHTKEGKIDEIVIILPK